MANNYNGEERFRPISAWGYFGYQLLFSIPFVGFIILIVFACGGTQNVNVKNYARSFFCVYLLILIVLVVLSVLGVFSGLAAGMALQ